MNKQVLGTYFKWLPAMVLLKIEKAGSTKKVLKKIRKKENEAI